MSFLARIGAPLPFYEIHRRLRFPNIILILGMLPMVLLASPFMRGGQLIISPVVVALAGWWIGSMLKDRRAELDVASEGVYLASRGVGRTQFLKLRWVSTGIIGTALLVLWVGATELRMKGAERSVRLDASQVAWLEQKGHPPEIVDDWSRNHMARWREGRVSEKAWVPVEVRLPLLRFLPWMYAMAFLLLGVVSTREPMRLRLWSIHGPFGGFILMAFAYLLFWIAHRLGLPSLGDWMVIIGTNWPVPVAVVLIVLVGAVANWHLRSTRRIDMA
jgi:hypothetical protein